MQIDIPQTIQKFLAAAHKDKRLLALNICIFMAICWGGRPSKDTATLTIYRKDILPLARMGSISTDMPKLIIPQKRYRLIKEKIKYGMLLRKPVKLFSLPMIIFDNA